MQTEDLNIFSDEHPHNLLDEIIADGGVQSTFKGVYRISKMGECNRDAFLCTALENAPKEISNRDAYLADKRQKCDLDTWSTSCWLSYEKTLNIYKLMENHGNYPKILLGDILPETGYSILTTERKSIQNLPSAKRQKRKHHVDWWIFRNIDVSIYFELWEV